MASIPSYLTPVRAARLLLLLPLGMVACRSKIDVKAATGGKRDPATSATSRPDEVAVKGTKIFFQSRDPVVIEVNSELLRGAPSYTVVNMATAGGDPRKAVTIIPATAPQMGLTDDGSFGLDDSNDGKMTLTFYPYGSNWQDKFVYGLNTLRVIALDPANPRYSTVDFTLADFDVFDLALASFADNTQVAAGDDYTFQGWVNLIGPAEAVADDGSSVTNGFFDMINP